MSSRFCSGLINEFQKNHSENFLPSLKVMQSAALMRSSADINREGRQRILDEISKLLSEVHDRKGILLGAGYVYYRAWKKEMVRKDLKERILENQPEQIKQWIEESFRIGKEAYDTLDENTLLWAYAANHCAYVGQITGMIFPEANKYLSILIGLKETNPDLWSPRFDDTIGCYYLIRAAKGWWLSSEEEKSQLEIDDDLNFAHQYLDEAKKNDPGDIDINEHIFWLKQISDDYRDYKSRKKLGA